MNLDLIVLKNIVTDKKLAIDFVSKNEPTLFDSNYHMFANYFFKYVKSYKELPTLDTINNSFSAQETKNYFNSIWQDILQTKSNKIEYQFYVDKLKHRYSVNELISLKNDLSSLKDNSSLDKYIEKINKTVFNIKSTSKAKIYASSNVKKYASEFRDLYNAKLTNPDLDRGIKTGYSILDDATGGLKDSELLLIGGESGGGKSMLLMNMSIQIWLQDNDPFKIANYKQGYNIVYFTLEMPIKPCFNRLAARMAEVPSKKIRNATLDPDEFSRLKSVLNFMEDYNFEFKIIDIPRGSNIDSIETAYEDCLNEFEPDIVAIDYLGLMEPKKKGDDDWIRLGYVAEEMHEFARKTKKTVLSAVQLNRTKSKDLEDKIGLHRIGRSGLIMHNANIGIQIETRPNEKQYPDLNYHLIKNRDGELTSGKLNKDFVCGRLTDINTINENDLNSMFKEVSFEKLKF